MAQCSDFVGRNKTTQARREVAFPASCKLCCRKRLLSLQQTYSGLREFVLSLWR
jgi:hypothetical protein